MKNELSMRKIAHNYQRIWITLQNKSARLNCSGRKKKQNFPIRTRSFFFSQFEIRQIYRNYKIRCNRRWQKNNHSKIRSNI